MRNLKEDRYVQDHYARLAQESTMTLGEGEAPSISPNGTMHKSGTKVSNTNARVCGTVFYGHEGKLYGVSCVGPDIGGWEQGYPGTGDMC